MVWLLNSDMDFERAKSPLELERFSHFLKDVGSLE
jgi:hypothetical protein